MKSFDDVWHQRANDVGKKRDNKEGKKNKKNDVIISLRIGGFCHLDFIIMVQK